MAFPATIGSASSPSSEINLTISCRDLADKDTFSKSDPIVALYVEEVGKWREIARTEHIKNNLNPDFATPIQMVYTFEVVQKLKFKVFDVDNTTTSLDDDDFLGELTCNLGNIVSAGTYKQTLKGVRKGTIIIRAEEMSHSKIVFIFHSNGLGLDKKDFFGKSDPYLQFEKQNQDGSYTVVHRTTVIKNSLNPIWPPFTIRKAQLGGDDLQKQIKVTCFDWDSDGSHDLIGVAYTKVEELESGQKLRWELINEKKKAKKKSYRNSGVIESRIDVVTEYSFLDYIVGGCQLNFTIGIDFTGSNGDPRQPNSLHYLDPSIPVPFNQYTEALWAVGSVVQDYDTDKQFPAFGFGAKLNPSDRNASHEFPLNSNPNNPYCFGINGVLDAYKNALQHVTLWGPTHAAPIINSVAKFAEQADKNPQAQNYFILLMLTDGELTDMGNTMSSIIRASHLPMSVIIVGVGNANFDAMEALDADNKLLSYQGLTAARDIVQFVPYRNFRGSSKEALARAVLAELPKQVVDYFKMKKVDPRQRPEVQY